MLSHLIRPSRSALSGWRHAPRRLRHQTAEPELAFKTFQFQSQLPRLSVPDLEATTQRYLRTIQPINVDPARRAASEKAVAEFTKPGGLGPELQARLHAYDQSQPTSWLESLWLDKGYLEWREPIFVNVSWWAQFIDSPTLGVLQGAQHPAPGTFTENQIRRAAELTQSMTVFQRALDDQRIPPELARKVPQCMNQYRYLFGTTRIPDFPKDRLINQYPTTARHIMVLARDQIFAVDVLGPNGELLTPEAIARQLREVVRQVEALPQSEPAVGVLTTTNRDIWATERRRLIQAGASQNVANFEAIDSALFAVCLDDRVDPRTATDINVAKDHFFHNGDGRNRWMDKSMQVTVLNNGRAGLTGEHTGSDAAAPGGFMHLVLEREKKLAGGARTGGADDISVAPPRHLKWSVEPATITAIQEATARARSVTSQLATENLHYSEFGSQWIKGAKMSPDSFVQMALQLAYYRLHRQPCPTYETASTRTFFHGRTETCRSFSVESADFTHTMLNPEASVSAKAQSLTRALASHQEYMRAASSGNGVDRHLLGLRCMIQSPEEGARATLFTDPAYMASMSFRISSSNLSPGTNFYGGFAPAVPDGYGSNYGVSADEIKLSISNWVGPDNGTSSADFKASLRQSFDEMHAVVEAAARQ
ncbi:Carnitine O-acetyltransferase mitochondrial [Tieghemiomyces parasiticus]|uniref:Carnitine O-acetyltransferase mitochondrial n=1 Tax=Tieghemiomyces parasiticus TaxID=78921 RepID=A0A9W7ZZZ4_9FUNG|nr:Carnitine O-acetyltransferase mitochondrial [Tieghemiomyces parasiticus]